MLTYYSEGNCSFLHLILSLAVRPPELDAHATIVLKANTFLLFVAVKILYS